MISAHRNSLLLDTPEEIATLVPGSVKLIELLIMAAALAYQGNLIWQVARDFIAPGNPPLMYAFTATVLALIGGVDFLVLKGFINLHYRTPWTGYLFATVALILFPVFVLEIGRLNVAQNGVPLATVVAEKFSESVDPGIREIERAINVKTEEWSNRLAVIDAAIDAEAKGIIRPDLEQKLAALGVSFQFTGNVGTSTQFQVTKNIRVQKKQEFDDFRRKITTDRATLDGIRGSMVEIGTVVLTPDNYTSVVKQQTAIAEQLKALGATYDVKPTLFDFDPVDSLFAIAVVSAFSFSATSLLLWGIAVGTTFGAIVLALLINAVVVSHKLAEHGGLLGADVELQDIQAQVERRRQYITQQVAKADKIRAEAQEEAREIVGQAEKEAEQLRWDARKRKGAS